MNRRPHPGQARPPLRPRPSGPRGEPPRNRGWDPVAAWYDKLVGEQGSDYHKHVILPAALRLLAVKPGEKVLDLCCGQGVMLAHLIAAGASAITAVDASPRLIDSARARYPRDARLSFHVADASLPGPWSAQPIHDAAVCILAVHDVADARGMFLQLATALRPGGRALLVMMHPCFRIPRQSHWGWDEQHKIQYRRLDCYHSLIDIPIATHPGRATGEHTIFHHRPLDWYLNAFGQAGLAATGAEELMTHRRSQPGSRSRGEHRAAREFPVFLALTVTRLPSG